jgi:amino acid adenylation domain-containing protein
MYSRPYSDKLAVAASQRKDEREFWLNKLSGELVKTFFPFDFLEGGWSKPALHSIQIKFPAELYQRLMKIAGNSHIRLNIVLVTGIMVLLEKYTGNEDIIIGAPIYMQDADVDFINTVLTIRNWVNPEVTFKHLILETSQIILEAEKNQNYPIERLLYELNMKYSENEVFPLFDIVVLLENIHDRRYIQHINTDSIFSFLESASSMTVNVEYNSALYAKRTVERIGEHLINLLRQAALNVDTKVSEIDILSGEEKNQLLFDFNDSKAYYPKDKTIIQLFQEQVQRAPDIAALVFEDRWVTYKKLDEMTNRLGRLLRGKGVGVDIPTGIMVDRSIEMVTGILGILKAGGAYVPVSAEAPLNRLRYVFDNASIKIVLTQEKYSADYRAFYHLVELDSTSSFKSSGENLSNINTPRNLAYIIYTSGSTGRPKGVMIRHQSVVNIVKWFARMYNLKEGFNLLQMFEYTFDASVNQIFGSLLHGVTLHIISRENFFDIEFLREYIVNHSINLINFVQSVIKELLCGREKLESLKYVISGAEKLKSSIKNEILDHGYYLFNQYGPTEVTVDALAEKCSYESNGTVGIPVSNAQCYIVNKYGRLNPVGVAGELWVSGDGLATGYINNVDLTVEKFIPNPFIPGTKVYKTGDLTRWLPAGNVEFLGRIDTQIKIRGFRIEPVEIASQLVKIPDIKEAVVIDREDNSGDTYLCAYIVGEEDMDTGEIKDILSETLPDYMIPNCFVWIDHLPLNGHGKLIRSELPVPDLTATAANDYVPPTNELEKKLIDIWSKTLNVEPHLIGINSDFFELGGHSLKATILVSRIHKELNVKIPLTEVFFNPTIGKMGCTIMKLTENKFKSLDAVEKKEYYILSSAQKRLYFLQQMDTASVTYNLPHMLPIGNITKDRLEDTIKKLVSRHESFRTSFHLVDGVLVQKIHESQNIQVPIYYYSVESQGDENDKKSAEIIDNFFRPFDLALAPVFRVGLIENADKECVLLMDMHHILTDGTSYNILVKEFKMLYAGEDLPLLRIQYKDYSIWQQNRLILNELKKQEEYWLKEFEGEIPQLNLPFDYPRPALQSFQGVIVNFQLGKNETGVLNKIARAEGATSFMILLAIYKILLYKLSNQDDLVVGTPVVGRRHNDLEKIIGVFINTLALRSHSFGDKTFKGFLSELKEKSISALENQDYPFEDLVNKVVMERDLSRNPLFDVMFSMENFRDESVQSIPSDQQEIHSPNENTNNFRFTSTQFDLLLRASEGRGKIEISITYCRDLFQQETIRRYIRYFKEIVRAVTVKPEIMIAEIDILLEEERNQLLFQFNNTKTDYPHEKLTHHLIEEQAERTPENIAVIGASLNDKANERTQLKRSLTYMELDAAANELACLLKTRGVRPGSIIGIMVERSLEMMIAIFSIMKAGGAYLPMDTIYPAERIADILKDSGVTFILTNSVFKYLLPPDYEIIEIDELHLYHPSNKGKYKSFPRVKYAKPTDLVYVIYTSGSTGKSKGVMIEHYSLINFIKGMTEIIEFTTTDSVLSLTTITFDIFGLEAILPLTKGSRVIMGTSEEQLNAEAAALAMDQQKVTILQVTPSRLFLLLSHELSIQSLKELKYLLVGGESFPEILLKKLQTIKKGKIYNVYGPTETTIWSTVKDIGDGEYIDIGKPIANTYIYILDNNKYLQPIGVVGELCIAGDGLSRGYLNRPLLTAEKFKNFKLPITDRNNSSHPIHNSISLHTHPRVFMTGDLARWLPTGNIQFLGRRDHQVKIRGFRIELGEIESLLAKHSAVKESVVVCREDENRDKYICVYFVPHEGNNWDDSAGNLTLREYLTAKLPGYMLPSYFIRLKQIPLTPSGKIDRKSLPHPEIKTEGNYTPPRDEIEIKLANYWGEILGRGLTASSIGIDTNFFHLGGQSLNAIQLAAKIHKDFNIKIPLTEILKNPTIRALSSLINIINWDGKPEVMVEEEIEEMVI